MYIVERVASAILWIERIRGDLDWEEIAATLGIMLLVGAITSLLVLLLQAAIQESGDMSKWTTTKWDYLWPILCSWMGVLWVRLRVWRKMVRWAERPKRVAERLRDAQ